MKKGQEMVQAFKTEVSVENLVNRMESFCNSFTPDIEGFIEALTEEDEPLKESFSIICVLWTRKLTKLKQGGWFDLRNQYAVETSEKIVGLIGYDNFYPEYKGAVDETVDDEQPEIQFVEQMARAHRTLQQTFSELVFTWLARMGAWVTNEPLQVISKTIIEKMDYMFQATPTI